VTYAFAAAGTGGHVYPALAVADAMVAAGVPKDDIAFFGGNRMEASAVPAAGYAFVEVEIRGLKRSLSVDNLGLPGVVRRAAARIGAELAGRKTKVLAVFGGYVSVPAALAARRLALPIVVHEQNARPGLANRLIAPRAHTVLVAFAGATRRLKRGRVVGNPLRPALADFSRSELRQAARERYGLPAGTPVLGVLGGSLGAQVLNEATARIAGDADPGSFSIVHLTGPTHLDAVAPEAARSPVRWSTQAFEAEMEYFYAAADVVLARAGALTVSELMATGTPAVLVPLEATHQGDNAAALAEGGGAVVIAQADIDRVAVELQQLLLDEARRSDMARATRGLAAPDAARVVAKEIMEVAGA
jgi:UDP-N-acetylglucosamine--N-acetylmuramyl-(pentapeptide) pyrophosphoryl-undecaprenol N-acetylglucosamine transferase